MRQFERTDDRCVYRIVTGGKPALSRLSMLAILLLCEATFSLLIGCTDGSASSRSAASSEMQATQAEVASPPAPTTATDAAPVEGTSLRMPSVSGTEATCNLGEVGKESKHTITFSIENSSGHAVQVTKVRSDCECITAVDPPKELAATGVTRVKVRFVAPKVAVPYVGRLIVITDDPQRKQISLWVKCRVKD